MAFDSEQPYKVLDVPAPAGSQPPAFDPGKSFYVVPPATTTPPVSGNGGKDDVDPSAFETKLAPADEERFAVWKAKYAPNDSGNDYDFRGAYKAGLEPAQNGHWSDQFKKPNHPTFSNESVYASQRPDLAGTWDGDKFVPPAAVQGSGFDPSKPFDIIKPAAPAAFDPSKPFEVVKTAAPAAFDPSLPHDVIPAPAGLPALKEKWDNAGALERLGMLWKRFSYDKSVEQAFQPNPDQAQIPTIAPTGSAPAQVGKTLVNTGSGIFNSLTAGGVAGTLATPAAALYAAPYFVKQAFKAIPEAFNSYMDPNASAADRTQKSAAVVMDALAAIGTGAHGLKATGEIGLPGVATRTTAILTDRVLRQPEAAAKIMEKYAAVQNRVAASPVRAAITYTRDAADNSAARQAVMASNDIRGPLARTFGKDAKTAEDALSFQIEALNNPDALASMRAKLESSVPKTQDEVVAMAKAGQLPNQLTVATRAWRDAALKAIDFAQKNFDALKPIAERYSEITKAQWETEHGAGQETPYRGGYVMHAQDLADPSGFEALKSGGASDGATSFKLERTHDTLADSIAAGVDPKSINSVDLLRTRIEAGQKLVNRDAWLDQVKEMKDPTNRQPVATNATVDVDSQGNRVTRVPDGYRAEQFGSKTIAVQKGYDGLFKAISDPSSLAQGEYTSLVQKANQTGKALNLLVDTFHLGRLAMWQSAIKASGLTTFKTPRPSFRQGLTLMDHSPQEITAMADKGIVPKQWLPKVLENKATLDLLEKNGMNTGRTADAMHQEWVRSVPGIGKFNHFVFEKFQRGAVGEIGLLEYERQRGMYPELSDAQVARKVATDVNTRFGNFGRQGIFTSKTFQDAARMIMLAPSWNEGLIKSELGAVKQGAAAVKDAVTNRRLASGMLARGTATMVLGQFAANQLINHFTRGHPTWKNPEEGMSSKLSAYIPDWVGKGAGFFLNPTALAAETSHILEKSIERDPDWQKALLGYARSRLSYLAKPAFTALTRTDAFGRPLRLGDIPLEMAKSAVPLPIGLPAAAAAAKQLVTGQHSETQPGQFQKQIFATGGVKLDNSPDAVQRISALAKDFNRKAGVPDNPPFAAGDYEPLSTALRLGNKNDARSALQDLLEHKTPKDVREYYERQQHWPFTGKATREAQFRSTLTPEQKTIYSQARAAKTKLRHDAMITLLGYLAQNKITGGN